MLATILRTPVADIMSIQIIDAFVYNVSARKPMVFRPCDEWHQAALWI